MTEIEKQLEEINKSLNGIGLLLTIITITILTWFIVGIVIPY